MRVDGDQFEIGRRTELEQAIVGAHRDMSAAGRQRHAEMVCQPGCALLEIMGGEYQMIEGGHAKSLSVGFRQTPALACRSCHPLPQFPH